MDFSKDSILQYDHQGFRFIAQPRALIRPIPIPRVRQLHVKLPEDLAKDKTPFGEEEPSRLREKGVG